MERLSHRLFSFFIGFFVGFFIMNSVYIIKPYQIGILESINGNKSVVNPGIHFKVPVFQIVHKFDARIKILDISDDFVHYCKECTYKHPSFNVYSKDHKKYKFEMIVMFYPKIFNVKKIIEKYGDEYISKAVIPLIEEVFCRVFSKYDSDFIDSNKDLVKRDVENYIKTKFKNSDFVLRGLIIRNIKGIDDEYVVRKIEDNGVKDRL